MKHLIWLFPFLLLLIGCNHENPACDWQSYESLAKVKSVEPYEEDGKTFYSVALQFNNSSLKNEIQYLEKLQDIKIDQTMFERNRIQVGFKYKFTVNEKLSGNCKSPIITFHHNLK